MTELRILPIVGIGEVHPGADVAALVLAALAAQGTALHAGDIVVITQKIISKAEGRLVHLADVQPSAFAQQLAAQGRKSAAYYELVLRESRRIVRMERGIVIAETHHGFICANAGLDESNLGPDQTGDLVALLPVDPDASAARLRAALHAAAGVPLAVLISDTWGRPWREGQVNVAIGADGIAPLIDYRGTHDADGRALEASWLAVADEIAGAAELVMNKADRVPAALLRGYSFAPTDSSARALLRDPSMDMFR